MFGREKEEEEEEVGTFSVFRNRWVSQPKAGDLAKLQLTYGLQISVPLKKMAAS